MKTVLAWENPLRTYPVKACKAYSVATGSLCLVRQRGGSYAG